MGQYAVLDDNNNVINIVVADSLESAQEHTGHTCVECEGNVKATVGGTYSPTLQKFIDTCNYPSWVLDSEGNWVAPIPAPRNISAKNPYHWDEETVSWVVTETPAIAE